MKLSKFSSTIILLHWAFSSTMFISPIQCTFQNASLMEQACRRSPNYNLCISSLRSYPRSSNADTAGLARIALEIVKVKATATLRHINKVYMQQRDPEVKKALDGCVTSYNMIVKVNLPKALSAMAKGDYKTAKNGAYQAGNHAELCEGKFQNLAPSPLSGTNKYVHDFCAIVASIVNNLLQPDQQTLAKK